MNGGVEEEALMGDARGPVEGNNAPNKKWARQSITRVWPVVLAGGPHDDGIDQGSRWCVRGWANSGKPESPIRASTLMQVSCKHSKVTKTK